MVQRAKHALSSKLDALVTHQIELARETMDKRRMLVVGFLAVCLPLGLMLGLQIWWLNDLEKTSSIARESALRSYLELFDEKVRDAYMSVAHHRLNIPASMLEAGDEDVLGYFNEWSPERMPSEKLNLTSEFFLIAFQGPHAGESIYYDPRVGETTSASHDLLKAVYDVTFYWQILSEKASSISNVNTSVQESGGYQIVIRPIVNDRGTLVGVAGMVVDNDYFRDTFLPRLVDHILEKFNEYSNLLVTVRHRDGEVIFTRGCAVKSEKAEAEKSLAWKEFSWIFKDYEIGLTVADATFGQWAKTSFFFNMTLSVILALALLGGILLAFRTASREMHLSDMKNEFVSNVSHELRTPISSIRVFGEMLRHGRVKDMDKIMEYGEYIETEGRRLTQLINNILDFSKIESGKKTYRFEETCMEDLVETSLKSYKVRLMKGDTRLHFELPEDALPDVRVDSGSIGQALCNLVDNAIKYSGEQGGDVTVALRMEGDDLVLSVADQGIGISAEEQQKVWDRFHRVNTGLVHDVKGSGLGLSIVKHVIDAHEGRLGLESKLGEGSTFSLYLPIEGPSGGRRDHEQGEDDAKGDAV